MKSSKANTKQLRITYSCKRCNVDTDGFEQTRRSEQLLCRECFGKKEDLRPRELNDLDGKAWAAYSRSVERFPDTRSEKQRTHGAAFPLSFAKQHIAMYSKKGDLVIDPFVGVGTVLDAAILLDRKAVGLDINPKFIQLAQDDLPRRHGVKAICDNALHLGKHVKPGSANLLITSPPYANLLKKVKGAFAYKWKEHSKISSIRNPPEYSTMPDDLGNLPYDDYLDSIAKVMQVTHKALKPTAYSLWVVKDFRDLPGGRPYVNLHGDIIACAEKSGFKLWDIRIYDQTQFRPLVCLGYPSRNYYLNIGHSYVLVFRNE